MASMKDHTRTPRKAPKRKPIRERPLEAGVFTDRIIAGTLKGRPLVLPKHEGLRPTKNRVRQGIFNLLGARMDWRGRVVADLFCGSGALGLEALSRGASKVFFVDMDTTAVLQNVRNLGLADDERIVLVKADALGWQPPAPLDALLADPPYEAPWAAHTLARIPLLLTPGGWWALEAARDTPLEVLPPCIAEDPRAYGSAMVWFGHKHP